MGVGGNALGKFWMGIRKPTAVLIKLALPRPIVRSPPLRFPDRRTFDDSGQACCSTTLYIPFGLSAISLYF